MAANSSLPMTRFHYSDEDLNIDVVDIIKLYPEIINMSNWRDATCELFKLCNQFHPYVFDILNDAIRTQFGACVISAGAYLHQNYDDALSNKNFEIMFAQIYTYMGPIFGFIGLIFALMTLILIKKNTCLHIPYGIIVFYQCLMLIVLLIHYSTTETFYLLQFSKSLSNNTLYGLPYGISINSDRIDRFMVYVNLSLSASIAFLRMYKTFSRFIALHFTTNYGFVYDKSFVRNICIGALMIAMLFFVPFVAFPDTCKVEITMTSFISFTVCSKILTKSSMVIRIAIALLGFILGILTVIKLRQYKKSNTWTKIKTQQERTLLIQTFCDLIDFGVMFIPFLLFKLVYLSPFLVSRITPYSYIFYIISYHPTSIACLGHSVDAVITFCLMRRIVRLNRQIDAVYVLSLH